MVPEAVLVNGRAPVPDGLLGEVLGRLAGEREEHRPREWLAYLGQAGAGEVAARLHDQAAAVSSKTPSTARHHRSQPQSDRELKIRVGTTGGFGVLILLTVTAAAIIAFFARDHHGENLWWRLIAPALALILLAAIVLLAIQHYANLLGATSGSPAAWTLPASYAMTAVIGLANDVDFCL